MVTPNRLLAIGWMISGFAAVIVGQPANVFLACVAIGVIYGVAADIIAAINGTRR